MTPPSDGSQSQQFCLTTLGASTLSHKDIDLNLGTRKSFALIAYLATRPSFSDSRQRIVGLLWGDFPEEKARASLRQSLRNLREIESTTDASLIVADRNEVRLNSNVISTDFHRLLACLDNGVVADELLTTKRIHEAFLEGIEDIDQGFSAWLRVQRRLLQDQLLRKLEVILERAATPAELVASGKAILNIDATHEPACRGLMLGSYRQGDVAGALRAYTDLWNILEEEFDTEPNVQTQQLVATIKKGEVEQEPQSGHGEQFSTPQFAQLAQLNNVAAQGLSEPQPKPIQINRPLIYLGKFEAINLSERDAGFVGIFRRELLAALARFRDWQIFEVNQSQKYERPGFVVSGDAYSESKLVHFVLTLNHTESGRFLWSERFSIGSEAWFDTMRQVIRRIAMALGINLSNDRLSQIAGRPMLSLELFDRWLRGQYAISHWQPDEEQFAQELFRSIVAEAPDFAPAHAGLADILNSRHLIFPGQFRTRDSQRTALDHARTAVAIDPLDSRTQLTLAWSYALNGDHQSATNSFLLAHELNGDDPWTSVSSAEGLALCGDAKSAARMMTHLRKDWLNFTELHWSYNALTSFLLGDYELCVYSAGMSKPLLDCSGACAAAALVHLGRLDDARTFSDTFMAAARAAWHSDLEPTNKEISRWMLHCYPVADATQQKLLRTGLQRAGFEL